MAIVVHSTAIVDHGARIGDGTHVWHWTHVSAAAVVGENCSLGQGVFVGNDVVIGNNVKIQNNVSVYDAVRIEDDVFCGPSVVFTNVINPRSAISRKHEYRPTLVCKGATLGANCTIVCGTVIGEYAFIGAGAVVTRDVEPYALMTGAPAKRRGWMCVCGVKLPSNTAEVSCGACGLRFSINANSCSPIQGSKDQRISA